MKKALYISAIAFMLAGGMLSSCSDFLEADNKTTGNKEADDALTATDVLYSAYNSLYSVTTEVDLNEEGTDLYIPVRGKTASAFDQYTLNAENADVYSYWKNLYTMVNFANGVLYYNTESSSGYNAKYSAEAKFIRCYGFYLLTQQFGSVPYVTEYVDEAKPGYPRVDVSTIYDGCIAELTEVYNSNVLATVATRGANVASPTNEAVALLISKFYLAKGWDVDVTATGKDVAPISGNENFTNAAEWAEKAINGKALSLTFAEKWSPFKDNNVESFWAIQPDRTNSVGAHSLQNDYGNYYGECTATGYKNVGSTHAQSQKSLYLFAKGDERYEATFATTILNKGNDGWGVTGYYAMYNNKNWKKVGYRYFPYYVTEAEAEATFDADLYSSSAAEGNNENVQAFILGNPQGGAACTAYTFDANGAVSTKTSGKSYSDLNVQVAGGVCVKKFDDAASSMVTRNDCYRAINIFDLSDAYLTAAEAYYMAGEEAEALAKVNAVRERAYGSQDGNLADFSEASYKSLYIYDAPEGGFKAIDIILDERARELYAERTRWIDLRRTKQLARYNTAYNPNLVSTVKTLRPIPANEISANSSISDQNPGY